MDLAAEDRQPTTGFADAAGDIDMIANACTAATDHLAVRQKAEGGHRNAKRPVGNAGVAAQQADTVLFLVCRQAFGKARQPVGRHGMRQRQAQQIVRRHRPLGGEVGQAHPQRLARNGRRRIEAEEIHSFGDGISGHQQIVAGLPR